MTVCLLAMLCLAAFGAASGAEVQQGAQKPIEAELLTRITSHSVRPGDTVYARVAADWKGDGCTLRRGATLQATVQAAQAHSLRTRHSQIALLFGRAECGDAQMQPFRMKLEAAAAPLDGAAVDAISNSPADAGEVSLVLPLSDQSVHSQADQAAAHARWSPGTALEMPDVRLSVGTGPESSSVFFSSNLDVELRQGTRLQLVPEDTGQPQREAASTERAILNPAALLVAPPVTVLPAGDAGGDLDNASGCGEPSCPPEEPRWTTEREPRYEASIALGPLGFVPRVNREIEAPDEDGALAWLGPGQLLVAFNPHQLVPRHGVVNANSTLRVIRAVLLDVSTRVVLETLDWQLPDKNQYLWVLPGDRILVHVENELRVYGSGLRMEKRIELGGPLAFLRISPDAKKIGIGIVRERHHPELHYRLAAILNKQPEEDLQILLMNGRFEAMAQTMSTTDSVAPVLLNEGQVILSRLPGQEGRAHKRYSIQLRNWGGGTRALGTVTSACKPELSTLSPDLAFMLSCDSLTGPHTYTVLRANGKLLLHGHTLLRDVGQGATGGGGESEAFAVRTFEADEPLLPGEAFHTTDLQTAVLSVYRSADGKRLFRLRVKDPAASLGGYALSGHGDVAVLAQDSVDIYSSSR